MHQDLSLKGSYVHLEKDTLRKQLYIRLKHIYRIHSAELYTFSSQTYRPYDLRLDRQSCGFLTQYFGFKVEEWVDTRTIEQTTTARLDGLANLDRYRTPTPPFNPSLDSYPSSDTRPRLLASNVGTGMQKHQHEPHGVENPSATGTGSSILAPTTKSGWLLLLVLGLAVSPLILTAILIIFCILWQLLCFAALFVFYGICAELCILLLRTCGWYLLPFFVLAGLFIPRFAPESYQWIAERR